MNVWVGPWIVTTKRAMPCNCIIGVSPQFASSVHVLVSLLILFVKGKLGVPVTLSNLCCLHLLCEIDYFKVSLVRTSNN